MRLSRWLATAIPALSTIFGGTVVADPPEAQVPTASSPDDARDRQIMERFKAVLEKAPRRGTSLDRVYGHHVERGTLDSLVKSYRDRVAADPKDGAAWLLIGLFESQRGRDSEAVLALREAEKARPEDALPSYYLGQALVLVGRPDDAAEAFERALDRKPIRSDLLEIFQALGRVHQRAHRPEKALEVWSRLEKLFPDDLRVQEQIAAALAEEDQPEQALGRYEKLAGRTTDGYRKIQFRLEAAGLKVRLGKGREALADFESILGGLDPDSWIARDVRRKIEDVFLRRDDLAGLAAYYEAWIAKTPDDIEAMSRLGRAYAQMGRGEDARRWLDKAVKVAPRRKDLRLALIELLRKRAEFAAASAEFEALHRNDPADPDVIRDWGRMLLADTTKTEPERRKAAAEVWRKLVPDDAKDPVAVAQAAELFRQAGLEEDAVAYFKKAIVLAPDAGQYREYLGEYYHALKRSDDALATWRGIAEGAAKNAKNLGRLGEVLAGFGYRKEALGPLTEAVALEPDDLDLRLKRADVLLLLDRAKEAETELDSCEKLAVEDEQIEAVLSRRVKALQATNGLAAGIASLRKSLETAGKPDAKGWSRLARYLEADGKPADAAVAAAKAVESDPKSVPALTVLARLRESTGDLLAAVDAYRTLTGVDRRSRTDYLTNIAKLEARLGRRDAALKAGRELLAAAPGNPEHDQFFADLCFGLGETEEGLEALRRSVRANPSDPKIMISLAENLAKQFRAEESIELYWRAFDKTNELEGKLDVVAKMTEQYLQKNQFDRLIARIERELREEDRRREKSMCLASAHAANGDYGSARQELEKLLSVYPKDLVLLRRLSSISESSGDPTTAANYQNRINELAPSEEGDARLAALYLRMGDVDRASAIWGKSVEGGKDSAQVYAAIDSLMTAGRKELAVSVIDSRLRRDPKNWELLYRKGVSLIDERKTKEADAVFDAILDLKIEDDAPSASVARSRAARPGAGARNAPNIDAYPPVLYRTSSVYNIRRIAGLDPQPRGMGSIAQGWVPPDFGHVRLLALAWKIARDRDKPRAERFSSQVRKRAEAAPNDVALAWERYLVSIVESDNEESTRVVESLARLSPDDPTAQFLLLQYSQNRLSRSEVNRNLYQAYAGWNNSNVQSVKKELTKAELDRFVAAIRVVRKARPGWGLESYAAGVVSELKRNKRDDEALALARSMIESATTPQSLANMSATLAAARDLDGLDRLAKRYRELRPTVQPGANNMYYPTDAAIEMRRLGVLAEKRDPEAILKSIDEFRAERRRVRKDEIRRSAPIARNPNQRINYSFVIYTGATAARSLMVDHVPGVDELAVADVQVLRAGYEIAKEGGWADKYLAHFVADAGAKSTEERVESELARSMISWWNEDRDAAVAAMSRASELAPKHVGIALALSDYHAMNGDLTAALAAVDRVDSIDQGVTQRRETAALRLAVRIGDAERARKAAQRLFGLRLDSQTQVDLANQMSRLGMYDMADAVLNRAQRDAGNRVSSLISLMYQFLNQGKTEQAVEVAFQVLRQSPAPNATSSVSARTTLAMQRQISISGMNLGVVNDASNIRRQALSVLSRTGRLKELIARLETQLAIAPTNETLVNMLIEYYTADNRPAEAAKLQEKLVKGGGDNPRARLGIAAKLIESGKKDDGIVAAREIFLKDPALLVDQSNPVSTALRRIGRDDDLYEIVEAIDLARIPQSWLAFQAASRLVAKKETRERGIKMFSRMLDAYPNERYQFIVQILQSDFADDVPNFYSSLRDMVFASSIHSASQPWSWSETNIAERAGGRQTNVAGLLVRTAYRTGKAADLENKLAGALENHPNWSAARAMRASLRLRTGRAVEGEKEIRELAGDRTRPIPPMTGDWLIEELEANGLADAAAELAAKSKNDALASLSGDRIDVNSITQLAARLQAKGKREEAVEILRRLGAAKPVDLGDAWQTANGYVQWVSFNAGRQLQAAGASREAVAVYGRAVRLLNEVKISADFEAQRSNMLRQLQQLMETTLRTAKPDERADCLAEILGTTDPAGTPVSFDLGLTYVADPLDKAALVGRTLAWFDSVAPDAPERARLRAVISDAMKKRPDDPGLLVATAYLDAKNLDAEAVAKGLARLRGLVEAKPLSADAVVRSAADRAPYADRIGLWLAAGPALKFPAARADAEFLADRALEAAAKMPSPIWAQAILREWGDIAFANGDKAVAERLWARLLDLIAADPSKKPTASRGGADLKTKGRVAGLTTTARPRLRLAQYGAQGQPQTAQLPYVRPETAPAPARTSKLKFDQALAFAKLAASRGMVDLSLEAVRKAFAAGPPLEIPETETTAVNTLAWQTSMTRMGYLSGSTATTFAPSTPFDMERGVNRAPGTAARLGELDDLWTAAGAPPKKIYETLRDAVLPPSRPNEVHLFDEGAVAGPSRTTLASRLIAAAGKAGRREELVDLLRRRSSVPAAELNALVLLSEIARVSNDPRATNDLLRRFDERLKVNSLQNTIELAIRVATPALESDATADAAAKVLDTGLRLVQKSPSGSNLTSIGLSLARYEFRRNRPDAARARLEAFLDAQDRVQRRAGLANQTIARRTAIETAAQELVNIDRPFDALELLGRSADLPDVGDMARTPNLIPTLVRRLMTRPADERYEKLKLWSLPTKDRRSVRLLGSRFSPVHIPAEFVDRVRAAGLSAAAPPSAAPGTTSLQWLLIDAARSGNKLDELAVEVRKLAADRVENAEKLLALIDASRGDFPAMAAWLDGVGRMKAMPRPASESAVNPPSPSFLALALIEVEAAALAFDHKSTETAAGWILDRWSRDGFDDVAVKRWLEAKRLAKSGAATTSIGDPGLVAWTAPSAGDSGWVVHEGVLRRVFGPDRERILFDYPLAGTFEIEAQFRPGSRWTPSVGFGDFSVPPSVAGGRAAADPDELRGLRPDEFQQVRIFVEPTRTRYYVNGQLVQDRTFGTSFPRLWLRAGGYEPVDWRHVRIKGNPEIPRWIDLLAGHGSFWTSPDSPIHYGRTPDRAPTPPAGLTQMRKSQAPPVPVVPLPVAVPVAAPGWRISDGTVRNEKWPSDGGPIRSSLLATAPARSGEFYTYEFYHEPGVAEVHPRLGAIEFLVGSKGVRIRMADSGARSMSGLSGDESLPLPSMGGDPPLKLKDWNTVRIGLRDGKVVLELNGRAIVDRKLDVGPEPAFGLHHDASRTLAYVRKARLTGDWPERLSPELAANLLAVKETPSRLTPEARDRIVDESVRASDVDSVVAAASSLPPPNRAAALEKFVLPSPDHASLRVNGAFRSDASVVSPAEELVAVSVKTGATAELAARVAAIKPGDPRNERARLALGVMIDVARGADPAAKTGLESLASKLSEKPDSNDLWPEFLAARAAMSRPALKAVAASSLDRILASTDAPSQSLMIHLARLRATEGTAPSPSKLAWFELVSGRTAETVGAGIPAGDWVVKDGAFVRIPGHGGDALTFRLPLTGDFEVRARLSTGSRHNETRLTYGGVWIGPRPDRSAVVRLLPGGGLAESSASRMPSGVPDEYDYRLVVKGATMSAYVQGKLVGEHRFEGGPRPWLALEAPPLSRGKVGGLAITGRPTIPASVGLVRSDLEGWTPYHSGAVTPTAVSSWIATAGELVGSAQPRGRRNVEMEESFSFVQSRLIAVRNYQENAWDSNHPTLTHAHVAYPTENLIRLAAPIADRVLIEFEQFQQRDEPPVAPTIGGTAYLMGRFGVRTHRVTDVPFDRGPADPSNLSEPKASFEKGATRPGAWVKTSVAFDKDKVSIRLDDRLQTERPLPPGSDRSFGLFHYLDKGYARVRNVVLEIDGAATLPAPAELTAPTR